uniref:Transmembrane protein n=1 Tax=Ditylenchus dipsaci TaxID=166011 RepID=A0A915DLV5_9BILA
MHGYIWSLNLNLDVDLSDKSAGFILDHQLAMVGYAERLLHAILSSCAVLLILWLAGYGQGNKTVWNLLSLSMAFGAASGLARCAQMKHRLYPAIHECFYVYLHFFVVGFCMTWRCFERFPKPNPSSKNKTPTSKDVKKDN